jgi:hypothetical protein
LWVEASSHHIRLLGCLNDGHESVVREMSQVMPDGAGRVVEHHICCFNPHSIEYQVDQKSFQWQSRQHRKGKSALDKEKQQRKRDKQCHPFKLYDISWWTAYLFLVGSIFWVINGIFVFNKVISDEEASTRAEKATSFLGGTFFLFGGIAMYLEALNSENTMMFDEEIRKGERNVLFAVAQVFLPKKFVKKHIHKGKEIQLDWKWYGWKSIKDISFMANFTQFLAVTVFWISVLTYLPGILPLEEDSTNRALFIIFFWVPQVAGAFLLIVSSVLLMLETQPNVWHIKPFKVDWHVGFWNILGSVGFFLSGLFGIIVPPEDKYDRWWGVAFSTYVGSFSFLIGTIFQYYEACT